MRRPDEFNKLRPIGQLQIGRGNQGQGNQGRGRGNLRIVNNPYDGDLSGGGGGIAAPTPPISGYVSYVFSNAGVYQSIAGTTIAESDGDVVGYWTDQSANSNHQKAAADNTTRPTLKLSQINGYAAIRFDGTNDLMEIPNTVAAPYTVVIVFRRMDAGTGAGGIWSNQGQRTNGYNWPALNLVGLVVDATHEADTSAFDCKSRYAVCGFQLPVGGTKRVKAKSATQTATGTTTGTASSLAPFRIGNSQDGGYGQIDIASVLLYNTALSDADLDTVINWYGSSTVFNLF